MIYSSLHFSLNGKYYLIKLQFSLKFKLISTPLSWTVALHNSYILHCNCSIMYTPCWSAIYS